MKKIFAMFLLMPSLVFANPIKPPKPDFLIATVDTVCISLKNLTEIISDSQEIPYVRARSHPIMVEGPPLSMVIFVNPKTGTFTIAEQIDRDNYCLLALGTKFEPVPKETQDKLIEEQKKGRL